MQQQLDIEMDPMEVGKPRSHEAANPSSENEAEQREYRDTRLVPVDGLEFHEAANLFPEMAEEEIEKLAADIIDIGMKVPIVLDDHGRLIDGRNRLRACKLLGRRFIEAQTYFGQGDAIVRFVISRNLHRRHLTTAQRVDIAARVAVGLHGGDRSKAQICALTQAEAANQRAVSERSVQNAKFVHEHGVYALQSALTQGQIRVSTAAELAALPAEEQERVVATGRRVVKAEAAKVRRRRSRLVSDDVHGETEDRYRKIADRMISSFVGLPEECQKRVVKGIAKVAPIRTWLDSADDETAMTVSGVAACA